MKKNLLISINKKKLKEFKQMALEYFQQHKITQRINFTHFFELKINEAENIFSEKGILKEYPGEEKLEVFFKPGKRKYISELYDHNNIDRIYFTLNKDVYNRYLTLMWSYWLWKLKNDKNLNYSSSFFFYDFIEIIKKGEL